MFDIQKFEDELDQITDPDKHAEVLEILLYTIRSHWDIPTEALDEVAYVLNKGFPEAHFTPPPPKNDRQ